MTNFMILEQHCCYCTEHLLWKTRLLILSLVLVVSLPQARKNLHSPLYKREGIGIEMHHAIDSGIVTGIRQSAIGCP